MAETTHNERDAVQGYTYYAPTIGGGAQFSLYHTGPLAPKLPFTYRAITRETGVRMANGKKLYITSR